MNTMVFHGLDKRPQVRYESDADFIANHLVSEYLEKQDAIDKASIGANVKKNKAVAAAKFELKVFEYSAIQLLIQSEEARRAFEKEFSEKLKTHDFKNKETQEENRLLGWLIKIAAVAAVYTEAMADGQTVEFPSAETRSNGHFDILINGRRYIIAPEKVVNYNVHLSRKNQSFWRPRGSRSDNIEQRAMERFSRCEQPKQQVSQCEQVIAGIPPVVLQIYPKTINFSPREGFRLMR